MRISRVYSHQPDLVLGQVLKLEKEVSNHLSRVLRLTLGDKVIVFNGDGSDYSADIIEIERNHVSVHIKDRYTVSVESPLSIHLYQGISRGDKMDLTLQKGVELGIKEFTPLLTERCGVKLDAKRWEKKAQHWEKVIQSACEQCGRSVVPTINPVTSLNDAIVEVTEQSYFLHPNTETSFKALNQIDPKKPLKLWVGPEGGFSDNEVEHVIQHGCTPVQLGPRILRTETAALAAVSAMNTLWGDF